MYHKQGSGKEIVLVFRGPAQENRGHPEGFVSVVGGWGGDVNLTHITVNIA